MSPIGAMIMSFFAAIWFALGTYEAGFSWAIGGIGIAISAAIVLLAARALRHRPPEDPATARRVDRIVGWASTLEGIGILVAVNIVTWLGRPDLVPCAIAVVVGLHFYPIAYGIGARPYYLSGTALVLIGIVGSVFVPPEAPRWLAVGIGAAIVLWLTSGAAILASPGRPARTG